MQAAEYATTQPPPRAAVTHTTAHNRHHNPPTYSPHTSQCHYTPLCRFPVPPCGLPCCTCPARARIQRLLVPPRKPLHPLPHPSTQSTHTSSPALPAPTQAHARAVWYTWPTALCLVAEMRGTADAEKGLKAAALHPHPRTSACSLRSTQSTRAIEHVCTHRKKNTAGAKD
jgi:hypothetical protein